MTHKNRHIAAAMFLSVLMLITAFSLISCRSSHNQNIVVSFNPMGGTPAIECQILLPGERMTPVPIPERRGFRFAGWYQDPPYYTVNWDFFDCLAWHTKTLYARWIRAGGGGGGGGGGVGGGTPPPTPRMVYSYETWHEAFDAIDASPAASSHVIFLACCPTGDCDINFNPIQISSFGGWSTSANNNRTVDNGRRVYIRQWDPNALGLTHRLEGGPLASGVAYHSRITVYGSGSRLILDGPELYRVRIFVGPDSHDPAVVPGGVFELRDGIIRNNPNFGAVNPWAGVNISGSGSRFYMSGGTIGHNRFGVAAGVPVTGGGVNVLGAGAVFNMSGGTIGGGTSAWGAFEGNQARYGGGVRVADGGAFNKTGGRIGGGGTLPSERNEAGGVVGNVAVTVGGGGGVYVTGAGSTFRMYTGALIAHNFTNGPGRNGGGVRIADNAQFTMNGGIIEHNTIAGSTAATYRSRGAGVFVAHNSTFAMNGGSINNNTSTTGSGGGVYVFASTFTMGTGATISGNSSARSGGGVYLGGSSTFTMNGGVIGGPLDAVLPTEGNNAAAPGTSVGGGGVAVRTGSTFTMHAGTISRNTSGSLGGGVFVYHAGTTFNMTGGSIERNIANTNAGGVLVNAQQSITNPATFNMTGGQIYRNQAPSGVGGGVMVDTCGHFNMSAGAVIAYNTALSGGGVELRGLASGTPSDPHHVNFDPFLLHWNGSVFYMSGGVIKNNTATGIGAPTPLGTGNNENTGGGGVFMRGNANNRFTMTGGTIKGNTTAWRGGGIQRQAGRFYMSGTAVIKGINDPTYPNEAANVVVNNAVPHAIGNHNAGGRVTLFGLGWGMNQLLLPTITTGVRSWPNTIDSTNFLPPP